MGRRSAHPHAGGPCPRQAGNLDRRSRAAAAARRLHLRRLSQLRRLGRHQEHPRHLLLRAMRQGHDGIRREAHPRRAAAEIPERRRRRAADARLWLRRRHQCARCGRSDPHAAEHRAEPEFRRRDPGHQPRLRKARARATGAGGRQRCHRAHAGRSLRRLWRHRRCDHDPGRSPPEDPQHAHPRDLPGRRSRHRPAMRRQRRLLRRHREPRASASPRTCWCAPARP